MLNADVAITIRTWPTFSLKDRETLDLPFGIVKEWKIPTNLFSGVSGFPVEYASSPNSANTNPNTLATSCIVEQKMIVYGVRMFCSLTISISHPRYSSSSVFDVLKTVNLMLFLFGLMLMVTAFSPITSCLTMFDRICLVAVPVIAKTGTSKG